MAKIICTMCGSDKIEVDSIRIYNMAGAPANDEILGLIGLLEVADSFNWEAEGYYCTNCESEMEANNE